MCLIACAAVTAVAGSLVLTVVHPQGWLCLFLPYWRMEETGRRLLGLGFVGVASAALGFSWSRLSGRLPADTPRGFCGRLVGRRCVVTWDVGVIGSYYKVSVRWPHESVTIFLPFVSRSLDPDWQRPTRPGRKPRRRVSRAIRSCLPFAAVFHGRRE